METLHELRQGDRQAWKELNQKLEALTEVLRDLEKKAEELAPYAERYRILIEQMEKIQHERNNVIAAALMAVRRR
ncbi:MAG: hypothetical protein K6U04_15720 [Armatimonadetes bacterium]|nr:hypothetical protein [Armatimonadota bacterium]